MKNINIAYIGGGSRGWAWVLMNDLALSQNLKGSVRLYDIDYRASEVNSVIGNRYESGWSYSPHKNIESALEGADIVVISILPGTFDDMEIDVHLPEDYGIYQPVGDTVGPGGMRRALRCIPEFMFFGKKIKEHCPDAWVINYTNPMAICTQTLYEAFPGIKALGCCHEVIGTKKLIKEMLSEAMPEKEIDENQIKADVLGINHFTWLEKLSYKDKDILNLYADFAARYYESGFEKIPGTYLKSFFLSCERVKFDLFMRYDSVAASGDRHLAEFCPGWYLKDKECIKRWKFNLTPVTFRKEDLKRRMQKSQKLYIGEEKIELISSDEEGVRIIEALMGLSQITTNVNLPNRGQLAGFPEGSIVETNALITKDKVEPVIGNRMKKDIEILALRHVYNQRQIIEGWLNNDKRLLFNAFANDPLVHLSIDQARELFDKMISL